MVGDDEDSQSFTEWDLDGNSTSGESEDEDKSIENKEELDSRVLEF